MSFINIDYIIADTPITMRGVDRYHVDEYDYKKVKNITQCDLPELYFLLKCYDIYWKEYLFEKYVEIGPNRHYQLVAEGILVNGKFKITESTQIWNGRLNPTYPLKINLKKIKEEYSSGMLEYLKQRKTEASFNKYFSETLEEKYLYNVAGSENFVLLNYKHHLDNYQKLKQVFKELYESRNDEECSLLHGNASRNVPYMFEEKEYYLRMAQLQKCMQKIDTSIIAFEKMKKDIQNMVNAFKPDTKKIQRTFQM